MPTTEQKLSRAKVSSAPPTNEIGGVMNGVFSLAGMAPWSRFVDQDEFVPELIWPNSVPVNFQMSMDTQLAALFKGTSLGVRHFNWQLDPNEADDAIVQNLAKDLNLPIQGDDNRKQPKARQRDRFSFLDHLRKALYAGKYGHGFFEQVGKVEADGLWHLKKLAERPPRTIQDILVAQDGGLVAITQNLAGLNRGRVGGSLLQGMPTIPVDRLVAYIWEQEGGDWAGESWFRPCYKNWLMKDRLMRIDVINHEKAGGSVIGIAPQGATPSEQRQISSWAKQHHVSMDAGAGLPPGSSVTQLRATGGGVVESMRYHDEAMARFFLLMVMQLGQTQSGSRALGRTFVDFFGAGLSAIANWFLDVFCEHVIEDWVDWNYGPDVDLVPRLTYDYNPELATEDIVSLITCGAIETDDELETELRRELGLPLKGTPRENPAVTGPPPQEGGDNPTFDKTPKAQDKQANKDNKNKGVSAGAGRRAAESAPSQRPGRPHPDQLQLQEAT